MSESPNTLADCPVCGAEFDPTAAGGWCTNSECGEWRYDSPDLAADEAGDAGTEATDTGADEEGNTTTPEPGSVGEGDEEPEVDDDTDHDAEPVAESVAETDGDTVRETARTVEDDEAGADNSADAADEGATIDCPGCGETLGADANFCPSCGEDVSDVDPEARAEALTDCPDCGEAVDPDDSFCASCGTDLDAHRGTTELTECPGCGADIGSADSFCVSCGENLETHREPSPPSDAGDPADGGESTPESLTLAVRGERVSVSDGDTVGRGLRRIVTETGGTEADAVRIHREHVRFERESDGFYLVDLGRNPTALNGTPLSEGDREPIGPGDELTLSGTVTLAVRAP